MADTTEYVYQLNLPPAENIFLSTFKGFGDGRLVSNYQYRTDVESILKPEWLNFCGIKWDLILYFKKDNQVGEIHTDLLPGSSHLADANTSPTTFGLNWVWGGSGIFEYWNYATVEVKQITGGADNTTDGSVRTYTTLEKPAKTYATTENCVYISHGGLPHRATGYPGRKLLSLRTRQLRGWGWNKIINLFKDYIIYGGG